MSAGPLGQEWKLRTRDRPCTASDAKGCRRLMQAFPAERRAEAAAAGVAGAAAAAPAPPPPAVQAVHRLHRAGLPRAARRRWLPEKARGSATEQVAHCIETGAWEGG